MPKSINPLFLLLFIFAFCLAGNGVYAFGAGNIPSFAYMEGRAFRHGDIEDALQDLVKKSAGGFALANLISKGSKFNGLDIKRVYFGNWLRDYSQAVDIAGLKKLPLQTILNLCMVLGFMAHGYATHEFEVTPERLGCYLPTEHIDNPKGYGDGEDARKYHPKLRGPVDPRELEVDPRSGMKNYIANESGSWDTSKALVRRTLEQCIHLGRQHRSRGQKQDEYEAYRLLGTALHTLEDFSAHSNFCELVLVSMGHNDVFTHVGDQVRIQAPNGKWVSPLVTGTFGSNDFFHSLLGEASDHLSEASVSDLNKELDKARAKSASTRGPGGSSDPADVLGELFRSIPGGDGGDMSRDLEGIKRIRAGPAQGGKRPEDMSPQELHAVLWQVLTFRDSVVKKISKTIEKIPGLGPLIEKLMDSISVFVFTTLEPFLKPILSSASSGLMSASSEVINTHDQYEVFNDPRASDPTHSFLSKDHFNLILNEPAGQIAKTVVINTVNLVTKAWDDNSINVRQVTDEILQCLFHPDFHNSNSKVQREMLQTMRDWVNRLGNKQHDLIRRLNKNSVRNHDNIRMAGEGGKPQAQGSYAHNQGVQSSHALQGYMQQIPGVSQAQALFGQNQGPKRDIPGASSGYPGAGHGHGSGEASSFYNEPNKGGSFPGGTSSYAPPSGPPPSGTPSYGGTSSYAPPSGPPPSSAPSFPGGTSSYAPPSGPPPSFPGGTSSYAPPSGPPASGAPSFPGSEPPKHAGYAPSYASPPPSFPGSTPHDKPPSFPGGPGPSFPDTAPSFPGAHSFPGGAGPYSPSSGPPGGYGEPGGYGQPGGYPPPMSPPGGYGGPGGYPPAQGPAPGGFPNPDANPGGYGGAPSFPGAASFPGADPYNRNQHGGGW